MSKAFNKLDWISSDAANNKMVKTIVSVANDYRKEVLPLIPAGTPIRIKFGGKFGFYGIAEINGVLHKVRVNITDLHNIDCNRYI